MAPVRVTKLAEDFTEELSTGLRNQLRLILLSAPSHDAAVIALKRALALEPDGAHRKGGL
jgi:hypothetical protein